MKILKVDYRKSNHTYIHVMYIEIFLERQIAQGNSNIDNAAAASGTFQLSSPKGRSSTIADAKLMNTIFDVISPKEYTVEMVPVYCSHVPRPMAHKDEKTMNAKLPAIDLLELKGHLLFFPNRRPTISAIPSPAAMEDRAITPVRLSVKNSMMEEKSIKV
mmetsp:Transcript_19715/g.28772  ORF Transcript_19715/g.28772 Transcript_19715/m.28772 type:complete len:160 (-) Transcript_19715:729-1208(-)